MAVPSWFNTATTPLTFWPRTAVSVHPLDPHNDPSSGWGAPAVSLQRWYVESTGIAAQAIYFPLHLPAKGTIVGISATFWATGSHSGMPGGLPKIRLYAPDGNLGTAIAELVDNSANVGALESLHTVDYKLDSQIEIVRGAYTLAALAESLTNAEAGLRFYGATVYVNDGTGALS